MEKEQKNNGDEYLDKLREVAEEQLKENKPAPPVDELLENTQKLLEELQVHQIELELQNKELLLTQENLAIERERYADLYNYAPVAYFLLDEDDIILDLNLSACQLLGKSRTYLSGRPLTPYLTSKSMNAFYSHREHVRYSGFPQICELELQVDKQKPVFVQAQTTSLRKRDKNYEGKHIWRTVMTDITEMKRIGDSLKHTHDLLIALSRGAQSVSLAATVEEIYVAVGDQIAHLGSDLVIFSFSAEEEQIKTTYTTFNEEKGRAWNESINDFFGEIFFSPTKSGQIAKVVEKKKTTFIKNVERNFVQRTVSGKKSPFLTFVQRFMIKQIVISPLISNDEIVGLLLVAGNKLTETDLFAIDVFAGQIAISLHKTRLIKELEEALASEKE